jgi:hypothetical protein
MPSDIPGRRDIPKVKEKDVAPAPKEQLSASGRRAMQGISDSKSDSLASLRQKAVRDAWKQEAELVKATGHGTREWKRHEIRSLTKDQKVAGYEGHHIRSVNGHSPKWAADPRNIEFVTRKEHLQRHGRNFHNPTTGKLIDRRKLATMEAKNRQSVRYARS